MVEFLSRSVPECNTVIGGHAAFVDPNSFPELVQRHGLMTMLQLCSFIVIGWFLWQFAHGEHVSWWPLLVCVIAYVCVPHVAISRYCNIPNDNLFFKQYATQN